MNTVDLKDEYRTETNKDVYSEDTHYGGNGSYSDEYVKWLELELDNQVNKEQKLPVDLVIEPTTIERNMLVWFNDDIHEVEFIIDDRIEVKELRSGTVFVATKEELTPVR